MNTDAPKMVPIRYRDPPDSETSRSSLMIFYFTRMNDATIEIAKNLPFRLLAKTPGEIETLDHGFPSMGAQERKTLDAVLDSRFLSYMLTSTLPSLPGLPCPRLGSR